MVSKSKQSKISIPEETTLHGIKDIYHAKGTGRVFWFVALVLCVVIMVFQLEGIFQSYLDESVGTRVTSTAKPDYVTVPALYYCTNHWLPATKAYERFMACAYPYNATGNMTDTNFLEKCYLPLWRVMVREELVTSTLGPGLPTDEESYGRFMLAMGHLESIGYDKYKRTRLLYDAISQFTEEVQSKFNGSLKEFVASEATVAEGVQKMPANGIITGTADAIIRRRSFSPTYQEKVELYFEALRQREGSLSLGLNGVCWKIGPVLSRARTDSVLDKEYYHYVVHMGGHVPHLRQFYDRWGFEAAPDGRNYMSMKLPVEQSWDRHLFRYQTNLYISLSDPPQLNLGNHIPLVGSQSHAYIKIWTTKFKYLNRRVWPCRENWFFLDQAHCNQKRLLRQSSEDGCKQYLPKSTHYPETTLSADMCMSEPFGTVLDRMQPVLNDQGDVEEAQKVKLARASSTLDRLVKKFTNSSDECPRPCAETVFKFEITYPRLDFRNDWCPIDVGFSLTKNTSFASQDIMWKMDQEGEILPAWETTGIELPCTKVSFQQTEDDGLILEEYPLYNPADIASSVGGTLGLWMGASALSFVQILYLGWSRYCQRRQKAIDSKQKATP